MFEAKLCASCHDNAYLAPDLTPLAGRVGRQRRCSPKEIGNWWRLGSAAPLAPPRTRLRSALAQALMRSKDPHALSILARMLENNLRHSISG